MMRLSTLPKTWIFDLDGVLATHNGHHSGTENLLPGVIEFVRNIPAEDTIVLLSSRDASMRETSLAFLAEAGVRIDHAIFGLPHGERILFNDKKPSGLPDGTRRQPGTRQRPRPNRVRLRPVTMIAVIVQHDATWPKHGATFYRDASGSVSSSVAPNSGSPHGCIVRAAQG